MFGSVMPVKNEMKVRDFEAYRAIYCGLCKQLGHSGGQGARLLLNYDLVLLAVLADSLSGEAGEVRCEGCVVNPLAKRKTLYRTKGLALAADGLILLSHHKLGDDLQDEGPARRLGAALARLFTGRMYRRAAKRLPELAALVTEQMARQRQIEAQPAPGPDLAADPTAQMCAALFEAAGQDEAERKVLFRLGMFCGQIVYFLDAVADFEQDAAKGRFNVYLKAGMDRDGAVAAAKARCRMAAGEVALCYNLLAPKRYKAILDNIFFLGLPAAIEAAGAPTADRRAGHGQIQSL